MQLIGQAVKHVSWGKGIITSFDKSGHIVSVLFAAGEKQFLYPDAFTHYLNKILYLIFDYPYKHYTFKYFEV